MPRRIVLFTRDAGLTVALRGLLSDEDRVVQFDSPDGRPDTLDPASDTIVIDLPGDLRRGTYRSIREWFSGRLVILLGHDEVDKSYDADKGCRTLFRPFQLDDLIRELAVPPGRIRSVISGGARRESASPPMPPPRLGPGKRPVPTGPPPEPVDRPARPDTRMGGARRRPKVGEAPADPTPPPGGRGAAAVPSAGGGQDAGPVPPAGGRGAGAVPPAGGGRGTGSVPTAGGSRGADSAAPGGGHEAGAAPPPGSQGAGSGPPAPATRAGETRGGDPDSITDLLGMQPPGQGAPRPGERMPPLASRARAAFPGRVDPPSRTASPDRPGPAPPAAAEESLPLVFDWFAPRGRRLDEDGTDRPPTGRDDPPANGTGQAPPKQAAPDAQAPAREPDSRQAREEDFRRRLDALRHPDLGRRADPPWAAPAGREGAAGPPPEPRPDLEPDAGHRPAPPESKRTPPAGAEPDPGGPAPSARAEPDHDGLAPHARAEPDHGGPAASVRAEPGRGEQPARIGDVDRPRMVDFRPGQAGPPGADSERRAEPAPSTAPTATTSTLPAAPTARRAAAGQPGERVVAPAPRSWAGPAPLAWRVLLAVMAGGLAVLVSGLFTTRSPELGAGEAAVAQVARSVAGGTGLAWRGRPVLDQPPLAPLAHAAWLAATGKADADLVQVVHQARLASSGLRGLAVGLLVLLVLALTERRQDPLLRFALGGAAGLLAALEPVLTGAGRAVTLEVAGVAAGLAALWLAWLLHERRAAAFVPAVGLASGVALLADGRSVVLLLVPLGFALLVRPRVDGLAGRVAAALAVGVGFWAAFAAWVARAPGAAGTQARLDRLAALAHLTAADRPLPVSRPLDLVLPRDLVTVVVLALAVPALVAVWRRGERAGPFLVAWNLIVLAAMVLLAGLGALDESWLVYAMPGAVAVVVLGLGAVRDLAASRGTWARRAATVATVVAVLALAAMGGYGWDGRYGRADDALARMSTLVARTAPCSALNAGNPADPDVFAVGQRRVTEFTSGGAALASGVRYFLLRGGDVTAGSLPGWLRDNGRQVASLPSPSHGSVQLWEVQQPPGSRVADLLRVNGGAFENVAGSACGGFAVLDGGGARFWSGYQGVGGKAVVGRPLSRPWQAGDQTMQAFDTMVLGSVPDPQGGPPLARPVALLTRLSRQAPDLLDVTGMPRPTTLPPRSIAERRQLLTEPRIAAFYLRARQLAAARPADWRLAEVRFGAPVSPPRRVPSGAVRQSFENVVIEVDVSGAVRLAPLGALAAKADVVPPEALRRDPVPGLPPPGGRYRSPGPVADRDLAVHLGAALGLWLLLALALTLRARLDRTRTPAPVAPIPAPPAT